MPHYSYRKTFTPGTDKESFEELEMPCYWGILTDLIISFPAGCHGLVHVHIDESIHQIFPTNSEEDYVLDDIDMKIPDEYELLPDTRKIYLRGYNEDDTYPHTIDICFTVKPFERYTPAEEALFRILRILERLVGR